MKLRHFVKWHATVGLRFDFIVKKYYIYLYLTALVLYSMSTRFYDKLGHLVKK